MRRAVKRVFYEMSCLITQSENVVRRTSSSFPSLSLRKSGKIEREREKERKRKEKRGERGRKRSVCGLRLLVQRSRESVARHASHTRCRSEESPDSRFSNSGRVGEN